MYENRNIDWKLITRLASDDDISKQSGENSPILARSREELSGVARN